MLFFEVIMSRRMKLSESLCYCFPEDFDVASAVKEDVWIERDMGLELIISVEDGMVYTARKEYDNVICKAMHKLVSDPSTGAENKALLFLGGFYYSKGPKYERLLNRIDNADQPGYL